MISYRRDLLKESVGLMEHDIKSCNYNQTTSITKKTIQKIVHEELSQALAYTVKKKTNIL